MKKPRRQSESSEQIDENDQFAIRSVEQLFTLFDGGTFLAQFVADHEELLRQMQDYNAEFGSRGAKGSFMNSITYEMTSAGDLAMRATADFKGPKRPASQAAAYVDGNGQLTLYSPLMRRMHGGIRDVNVYDPDTGVVREI